MMNTLIAVKIINLALSIEVHVLKPKDKDLLTDEEKILEKG